MKAVTPKKGLAKSTTASTDMLKLPALPDASTLNTTTRSLEVELQSALNWLKNHTTQATLDGMARYAIPSDKAIGVAMRDIKVLGKKLGPNHPLASAL